MADVEMAASASIAEASLPASLQPESSTTTDVDMNGESSEQKVEETNEEAEKKEDELPEDANETLYIQNLNESVRTESKSTIVPLDVSSRALTSQHANNSPKHPSSPFFWPIVLKETLHNLFKPYRPLPTLTAHRNIRMRGQAFISFQTKEQAEKARKDVMGFPLYGKPMVSEYLIHTVNPLSCFSPNFSFFQVVKFAKTRSDVVVTKIDGEQALESWKAVRKEHKSELLLRDIARFSWVSKICYTRSIYINLSVFIESE